MKPRPHRSNSLTFIDLFAGCGGLTLGLLQAGWKGLFGVERDPWAFESLKKNFLGDDRPYRFEWPAWLPEKPIELKALLSRHRRELKHLRGRVLLVAGAPPCQGYSFAGRRRRDDRRNSLFTLYVEFVKLIRPAFVLVENVGGITVEHGRTARKKNPRGRKPTPYSERLLQSLKAAGYAMQPPLLLSTSDYGVPQTRSRFIAFGIRKDLAESPRRVPPLDGVLSRMRIGFLQSKGLPTSRPISAKQAISDLERKRAEEVECLDPASPSGFKIGLRTRSSSAYQVLMHKGCNGEPPDSHRFVNHGPLVLERFRHILAKFRSGTHLSASERKGLGLKKRMLATLSPDKPSHTLTTLPDDLIHYAQPRVLTVREYARLQSFPDWFKFGGNYTTGGLNRKNTCPRYTQVGNAVPPLAGEVLGLSIARISATLASRIKHSHKRGNG